MGSVYVDPFYPPVDWQEYQKKCAEAAMLREALDLALDSYQKTLDGLAAEYNFQSADVRTEHDYALSGSSGEWLARHDGEKDAAIAAEKARADANYQSLERIKQKLSEKHTEHKEALARAEKAEAERDGLAQKLASEKESRVKYQDIVYAVCNSIDSIVGRNGGLGVLADKGEITTALARIKAEARRKALLCAANHTRAKSKAWRAKGETLTFAAQLESELELRAENEGATAPTVKESETVRPCRCDRDDNGTWHGKCTCQKSADEAKRVGWLEAANFLETLGQFSYARALRREAGVVESE